jgi:hypothetical protein
MKRQSSCGFCLFFDSLVRPTRTVVKRVSFELLAKVRNFPFDRLRVNGLRLKLFSFSIRGELVAPQKNTFAKGSFAMQLEKSREGR